MRIRRILEMLLALAAGAWAEETSPAPLPEDPEELVELLGNPNYERREAAQKKLEGLGDKAEPALRAGVASKDPEIAVRAKELSDSLRLAKVEMGIAPAGEAKAGQDVPLRITVTNRGKEDVLLLKFLAGLYQPGEEGPTAYLEVRDAQGREIPQHTTIQARSMAALEVSPYFELSPGAFRDFEPGEGFNVLPFHVDQPGRYTVTLVYVLRKPFDLKRSIVLPDRAGARQEAQAAKDAGRVMLGGIRSKPIEIEVKK